MRKKRTINSNFVLVVISQLSVFTQFQIRLCRVDVALFEDSIVRRSSKFGFTCDRQPTLHRGCAVAYPMRPILESLESKAVHLSDMALAIFFYFFFLGISASGVSGRIIYL